MTSNVIDMSRYQGTRGKIRARLSDIVQLKARMIEADILAQAHHDRFLETGSKYNEMAARRYYESSLKLFGALEAGRLF